MAHFVDAKYNDEVTHSKKNIFPMTSEEKKWLYIASYLPLENRFSPQLLEALRNMCVLF